MKTRIISAILMLLVFVPVLLLGNIYYVIFSCILGVIALWEIERQEDKTPIYIKIISYFLCILLMLYDYNNPSYVNMINYPILGIIFVVNVLGLIINGDLSKYNYRDCILNIAIILIVGILFNSFIRIRMIGLLPVIYCFLISMTTDTFAYVGGKLFGKNKLSPNISPNKTVEGGISGSLMGTIMGSVFYYNIIGNVNILVIVLISFSLTIFCQIGDLFFSSIKRYYKIKDFSNLIPGHGGILDRLDSVLFVILGFLLYSLII